MKKENGVTRREFVKLALATGVAVGATGMKTWAEEPSTGIPLRPLGRTGEKVSCIGLGGAHLGHIKDEQECLKIVRSAIDNGITFMDNCWDYGGGSCEMKMGRALLEGYREKVFLMTKIDGRTKEAAARQIDECLTRLQTDRIDLMQIHEIIRLEDPDRCFAPGGGMEALLEAQKAGKIRYIGFTGHKDPYVHLRMLEVADAHQFRFDAVQMPLNVMDAHFRSFEKQVLPQLVKNEIGVLGMKSMGSSRILQSKVVSAPECLRYALNLPTSVVITGIDSMPILDQALQVARTFKPMDAEEVASLLNRTHEAAMTGDYEWFKTSTRYDGTAHHPEWLG